MSNENITIAVKRVPVSENGLYATSVNKDEGPVLIIPEGYTGKILPDE